VFGKQHQPFKVKLVHNAMESFQQKVPPILFGAFEDIFDCKVEETTRSVGSNFLPLEKVVYNVTDLQ
jgi:hypothetical protein